MTAKRRYRLLCPIARAPLRPRRPL